MTRRHWARREQPTDAKPTDYGQTHSWRAPSPVTTCVRCRGFYVDDADGRSTHRVVFGHTPAQDPP